MSASPSYSATISQTPSSGFRLRPVRPDPVRQLHSASPSPPPSSGYGADVASSSSARMPPPPSMHSQHQDTQALPSLSLSPTSLNEPPRPWSPPAGVREIDAAPPPRRPGVPVLTGHDLMALFPPRSPNWPPTYATPPNPSSASGSTTSSAPTPVTIPTSGWFMTEERKFFAREGKEISRLKREEILGLGPSGSGNSGMSSGSTGMKRERESEGDREMQSTKRSPPAHHPGPFSSVPVPGASSSSFHSSPPTISSNQPAHNRSHSGSQVQSQQPFLTLVQSQPPYRQPPPPPPRDREPAKDRERGRDVDSDVRMHSVGTLPIIVPDQQQGANVYAPGPVREPEPVHSSPPPTMQQGHGRVHARSSSYGSAPLPGAVPASQQQQHQQYTYTHSSPSPSSHPAPPHPQSQPVPPHMRGSYTHPPPPPPAAASRGTPSYSVQPPSHPDSIPPPPVPQTQAPALNSVHPAYSAMPSSSAQHPPPHPPRHQPSYSVSPPSHAPPVYIPDPYTRDRERARLDRERGQDRGREAYPSPSPSRNGRSSHPNVDPGVHGNGYPEGFAGGSAYLSGSERRRAGKHTRRVVVKA